MFSKKPELISSQPAGARRTPMPANSTFSVIGADVTIRGQIDASADLHVDGKVFGDVSCAALVTGTGSVIEGEIVADRVRLAGSLVGKIRAGELVVLKTARIEGDVTYETLTIEQGAMVNGRLAPHGAEILSTRIADAEFTDAEAAPEPPKAEATLKLAN